MEKLPKELLIEIFDYLSPRDFLYAVLVCKSFNNIIHDSTTLRRKFRLNLHTRKIESMEWIGSRNYSRVILRNSSKKSLNIMKVIASNITDIRLMFGRMYMKSFKKILLRAKNLKEISIFKMDLVDCEDDFEGELPKLSLDNLTHNGHKNLFRLMKDCSVKKLSVYSVSNTTDEITYFKKFLKRQNSLETLEFSSFDQEWMLFEDEILSIVDFRLKKLSVHNIKVFDIKYFKSFLLNHKDTLEELVLKQDFITPNLKLIHEEIFGSLNNFTCLKSLNFLKFTIPQQPFLTITKLTIQNVPKVNFEEICANFPNVKSLNIFSVKEIKAELTSMKFLEKLTIESSKILILNVKPLEKFKFSDMQLQGSIFENNYFNQTLIDDCGELQHLFNFLKSQKIKMNLLKIENCQLTRSDLDFLTSLSGSKVTNLIVVNCNEKINNFQLKKLKEN